VAEGSHMKGEVCSLPSQKKENLPVRGGTPFSQKKKTARQKEIRRSGGGGFSVGEGGMAGSVLPSMGGGKKKAKQDFLSEQRAPRHTVFEG